MQVTKNFTDEEFACKCGCGFKGISKKLVEELQILRDTLNAPITINSGCRCEAHNKKVGGAVDSQHTKGIAADIVVKGFKPETVYQLLEQRHPNTYGLGLYKTWVHIDVRPIKARWSDI